jgi:tetratricopeptide (TPR) repeat protein
MPKPNFPKLRWEIDPNVKCPCGSGLSFRKCCRGKEGLIEKAFGLLKKKDYPAAEQAWRATLTRYIGWVFRHTLVLLNDASGSDLELVKIDINALDEIVDRLTWILFKEGKSENIIYTFDHVATTVPLPGLRERMVYLKCLWLIHQFKERENASKILNEWPSYEKIQDVKLLQIYYELRADSLSLTKRIDVVQKIIHQTTSPVEKLHYSIAKTMLMLLVGSSDEAKQFHTEALNQFLPSAADAAKEGDYYSSFMCAGALEMQGTLHNDKIAFERGLSFLEKVKQSDLIPEAQGDLLYQKGRLNWLKGDSLQAIECFSESYNKNSKVLPLIYRLDEYVSINDLDKAKQDLVTIRRIGVSETEKLEFLRSATGLAIKTGGIGEARSIVRELKALDLDILNFRVQRDELCFTLLEFVEEEANKKISAARRETVWQQIQKLFEYLELKPNIWGIGLNLNRFFERKEKDRE